MDVRLSLIEKEFSKEYSSYRRLFGLLCNQEERMRATCIRLGDVAVKNGLWHDLADLPLQKGEIAQITLVRKDGALVYISPAGITPKKLYEKEKGLSKGYLFLVETSKMEPIAYDQ